MAKKVINITIDEAGRGPLAGPVTVGAVIQRAKCDISQFTDSKKLTPQQREVLFEKAQKMEEKQKIFTATGRGSNSKIDKHGIIKTLREAVVKSSFKALKKFYQEKRKQALKRDNNTQAIQQLDKIFSYRRVGPKTINTIRAVPNNFCTLGTILIDGNSSFGLQERLTCKVDTLIKGDLKNKWIGMASIIAKVSRDRYMVTQDKRFPGYGFKQHYGYGTPQHRKAIGDHGISSIHRATFCTRL